jgi:hypothetical protein
VLEVVGIDEDVLFATAVLIVSSRQTDGDEGVGVIGRCLPLSLEAIAEVDPVGGSIRPVA